MIVILFILKMIHTNFVKVFFLHIKQSQIICDYIFYSVTIGIRRQIISTDNLVIICPQQTVRHDIILSTFGILFRQITTFIKVREALVFGIKTL